MSAPGGLANPYREPDAEIVAPHVGPRFRVRLIAAAFCYFTGGSGILALLVSSLIMGLTAYRFLSTGSSSLGQSAFAPSGRNLGATVLHLAAGVRGLLAARAWTIGEWRRASFSTVMMVALFAAVSFLHPFR